MNDWPAIVKENPKFEAALLRIAEMTRKQAMQYRRRLKNSEFVELTKAISTKASKLLDDLEYLHNTDVDWRVMSSDSVKDAAIEKIKKSFDDGNWKWDENEELHFRAGMGGSSDVIPCQSPLLGLMSYMDLLTKQYSNSDSRGYRFHINTSRSVIRLCEQANIPLDRKGSAITRQIIRAVFKLINEGYREDSPLLKPPTDRQISQLRTTMKKDKQQGWPVGLSHYFNSSK